VIAAVNAAAGSSGISPGMGLADARALVPGLHAVQANPAGDVQALSKLAEWCRRYTPMVAIDGLDGLFLDVTGCTHLFHGETAMLADLMRRLGNAGLSHRAVLAGTPAAAWAVARFGADAKVIEGQDTEAALSPLPIAALRLPRGMASGLARMGLRHVEDLLRLDRASRRAPVAARFGPIVWQRLDQAMGRLDEPISPIQPTVPHRVQLAFAEPISTADDIGRTTHQLLMALSSRLGRENVGARLIELSFYRVDGAAERVKIGTSQPSRDVDHLFRLFREKLEGVDPGFGIDLAVMSAPVVEVIDDAQIDLPDNERPGQQHGASTLPELIDRLSNRLGKENVFRTEARESHVPERAVVSALPLSPPSEARWRLPPRPTHLFADPVPVEVTTENDAPATFRWRVHLYRIRALEGPEHIGPEWWRGQTLAMTRREYWRVEEENGRRFWLYRAMGRNPSWFLHGEFA